MNDGIAIQITCQASETSSLKRYEGGIMMLRIAGCFGNRQGGAREQGRARGSRHDAIPCERALHSLFFFSFLFIS